jgi:hypothetical protein
MLTAAWAKLRPDRLNMLTGQDIARFTRLAAKMELVRQSVMDQRRTSSRQRKFGGGRRGRLCSPEQRLLFVLVYLRHYPTQEIMGILFGLSQESVCEHTGFLMEVLQNTLGKELVLPKRPNDGGMWLISHVPGLVYMIDGFDRPRQRPVDAELQTSCYSGKKKRHSIKNTLVIDAKTRIAVGLGKTYPGRCHDKALVEADRMELPNGSSHWRDTGYQGLELANSIPHQPKKKPKGKELTDWDKFDNRCISMERVFVEHAIRGIKIHRIAKDILRNRRYGIEDLAVELATGMYNYRIAA